MEVYFPGDTYDTPVEFRRLKGKRILFGGRWNLYSRFIYLILKYRRFAVKGIYDDEKWAENSYAIFKAIENCGGRFHLKGIDNLRKSTQPVVLISNHMSTLETVIFPAIIAPLRPLTFVIKKALAKSKIFGPIINSKNPVVIERKNPREDLQAVLTKGKKVLENNRSIIIFPQGTRQNRFDPEKFNTLGIKLAARAGVKVIPVAVKTDFWGNGKLTKEFGPVSTDKEIHMVFGEPMSISGKGKAEHKKIIEFIQSHLKAWGGQLEEK